MKKNILFIISIFITLKCFADDGHGWINPFLGGFEIQESSSIEMTDEEVAKQLREQGFQELSKQDKFYVFINEPSKIKTFDENKIVYTNNNK